MLYFVIFYVLQISAASIPNLPEVKIDQLTYNRTSQLIKLIHQLDGTGPRVLGEAELRNVIRRSDADYKFNYNIKDNDTSAPIDVYINFTQVLLDTNHIGITGLPPTLTTEPGVRRNARTLFIRNPEVLEIYNMRRGLNKSIAATASSESDDGVPRSLPPNKHNDYSKSKDKEESEELDKNKNEEADNDKENFDWNERKMANGWDQQGKKIDWQEPTKDDWNQLDKRDKNTNWDKPDLGSSKKQKSEYANEKSSFDGIDKTKDNWKPNKEDIYESKKNYDDWDKPTKKNDWDKPTKKNDWDKPTKKNDWNKLKENDENPRIENNDKPKPIKDKYYDDYNKPEKSIKDSWNIKEKDDYSNFKKNKQIDENKKNNWDKPNKDSWNEPTRNWNKPVRTRKRKYESYDYDRPKKYGRERMYVRTPIPYRGKKGIYEDD